MGEGRLGERCNDTYDAREWMGDVQCNCGVMFCMHVSFSIAFCMFCDVGV